MVDPNQNSASNNLTTVKAIEDEDGKKYELGGTAIGSGSFGEVYKAKRDDNCYVALKVFKVDLKKPQAHIEIF